MFFMCFRIRPPPPGTQVTVNQGVVPWNDIQMVMGTKGFYQGQMVFRYYQRPYEFTTGTQAQQRDAWLWIYGWFASLLLLISSFYANLYGNALGRFDPSTFQVGTFLISVGAVGLVALTTFHVFAITNQRLEFSHSPCDLERCLAACDRGCQFFCDHVFGWLMLSMVVALSALLWMV